MKVQDEVLVALVENGPQTVPGLAAGIGLTERSVRGAITALARRHHVHRPSIPKRYEEGHRNPYSTYEATVLGTMFAQRYLGVESSIPPETGSSWPPGVVDEAQQVGPVRRFFRRLWSTLNRPVEV